MPRRLSALSALSPKSGPFAVLLLAVAIGGCGSGQEETVCGPNGCSVCDGYGCRPADPSPGGSGGSSGSGGSGPEAAAPCDSASTTCPCSDTGECHGGMECIDGLCLVPCEYSSECGGGRICANGKCVVGCDALSPCPEGYACGSKGLCEADASAPQCGPQNPCAGGLVCAQGLCVGSCTSNNQCAPGEICDSAGGTCIVDPQPKPPCEADPSVCTAAQSCVGGYCRYACDNGSGCVLIDARIPICDEGICKSAAEASPQCLTQEDCESGQDCVSNACM